MRRFADTLLIAQDDRAAVRGGDLGAVPDVQRQGRPGQPGAQLPGPRAPAAHEGLRRDRTARVQLGSRRQGAGYDSSGSQLIDRRWIYEYDAWAEAVALT